MTFLKGKIYLSISEKHPIVWNFYIHVLLVLAYFDSDASLFLEPPHFEGSSYNKEVSACITVSAYNDNVSAYDIIMLKLPN